MSDSDMEHRAILKARALELEQESASIDEPSNDHELLVFQRGEHRYAIPTEELARVEHLKELTTLPLAPPILLGITLFNGEVLPIFDLQRLWNFSTPGIRDFPFFIVIGKGSDALGFVAEQADTLRTTASLNPADLHVPPTNQSHVIGILEENLLLLDVPGLLAEPLLSIAS